MSGQQYRIDFPSSKTSAASSVRYDFSGEQEIRKRQDAISEMANQKLKALYEGDVMAAMAASKRIRALRDSISGIQPVKVEAESSQRVADLDGPRLHATKPAAGGGARTAPQGAPSSSRSAPPDETPRVRLPGSRPYDDDAIDTDVAVNTRRKTPADERDPNKKPGTVTG